MPIEANTQALLSLQDWAPEQPGPGRWQGGQEPPGALPWPQPQPRPLCTRASSTGCQGFKGCAKQAGGPGQAGSPEMEMGEQKEAMWAGLAGACGGTEGGKGEAAEGGLR